MSAHVEMTNLRQFPGGYEQLSIRCSLGEDSFGMPLPVQFVSGPVAITPLRVVDEQARSVTFRMDRWQVLHTQRRQLLPLVVPGMAAAARIAHLFQDDPGISWEADAVEIEAWASAWAARANAARGGEQDGPSR
ncbi:hypothetical protein IQ251_14130 [Saccharopolyspora sp. HNM0983]|uniref:Uncharacterized protein n=1 Tax=Saccharopolyspora montiporae TaxID=2781240 RepID=A0A929B974_9PSEU|nr:hypothetical protein [Saccharopolyspora sp. HNM0983]MBE9375587.1 hypothetical protein [Saccharopolyspora sp. HNM0983]